MKKSAITAKAKKIKILLMDVDGVLTDGRMYFMPVHGKDAVEMKGFNALDGIGLRLLRTFGISIGVITGRISGATQQRAKDLCMKYAYQGFLSKLEPLELIMKDCGVKAEEIAYIGDDLTDIPVMKKIGLACAPANAWPDVKKVAHVLTRRKGGSGAVREVCELILKSQGKWPQVLKLVEAAHWPPLPKEKLIIINAE